MSLFSFPMSSSHSFSSYSLPTGSPSHHCIHNLCLLAPLLLVCVILSSCSLLSDEGADVQAMLDHLYLGQHSGYLPLAHMSEEQAEAEYMANLDLEVRYFLTRFGLNPVSAEVHCQLRSMYANLYQSTRCRVNSCSLTPDGCIVRLSLHPLTLFADLEPAIEQILQNTSETEGPQKEVHDNAALQILKLVKDASPEEHLGDPITMEVFLSSDGSHGYVLTGEALEQIDSKILLYDSISPD